MIKLKISFKGYALNAELYETSTAKEIYKILPFSSKVTMWGKELYFTIPVNCDLDAKAREVVSVGELGFWPTGNAFCKISAYSIF